MAVAADPVISVRHLTKRFGRVVAINDVTFRVERGEILGLLGPNGAGKTTTLQVLLGLITPTSGEVRVFGLDVRRHRRAVLARCNFTSTYAALPGNLTVWENLNIFAKLYGIRRPKQKILDLLTLFEIPEVLHRKTGLLSTGQQTRLFLCKAFLNDPLVLFLDEPTASLDPDIAAKVRDILCRIQQERGVTMIYTSHNMVEIERMCRRLVFLHRGMVVAEGTPADVLTRARSASLEEVFITLARDGTFHDRQAEAGP